VVEEVRELDVETIKKLAEKAEKEDRIEARFFLKLEYANYNGYHNEFKIIHGDADEIETEYLKEIHGELTKYLIVPRALPVIVLEQGRDTERQWCIVHVFTKDGWKFVEVR